MIDRTIAPQTLLEVLQFVAPFAGGSIPDANDQEFIDWVNWIGNKQDEYARRAFWRRCLTREVITISGETTVLPARFHKPNGLYMLIVDGIDWYDPEHQDTTVFVEMNNDPDSEDFAKWQLRFSESVSSQEAIIWYFANPPRPTQTTDKLILPGDMIGYAVLAEYYRTTGAEGSQDKAEEDAENRFEQYLSLEVVPPKNEIHRHTHKVNRLHRAKQYYTSRPNRNIQW
jgi:hypothetical protein